MNSLIWFHDQVPKYLLWHSEEGDTHRMGKRNGIEEEGQELMPKLFLVLNSAGSHCCPAVVPNTSQTWPEISRLWGLWVFLRLCNLVFIHKWENYSLQGLGSTSRAQIILLPSTEGSDVSTQLFPPTCTQDCVKG